MGEEQYPNAWELWWELADRHCRTLEEVSEDMLLPRAGLMEYEPFESQRHLAIAHVLCSIPPSDYQRLAALVDSFCWFIPHYQTDGHIEPFPITVKEEKRGSLTLTYAKVLYLSPRLERAAWDITVATVAHELAHIALGHSVVSVQPDVYEAQEAAAWLRVCDWGFEREAKKQEAMYKRRASLERRMIERFRQRTVCDCNTIREQRR